MISGKENPISITTEKDETIECDKQIKILGWWSNQANTMETHFFRIKSAVHHSAYLLKPALKHLNLNQRKEVVNAKILSKLSYGLALYIGQSEQVKSKLYALIMFCYRLMYAKNTYMMRNSKICDELGVDYPDQLLIKSALSFTHKICLLKRPADLTALFRSQRLSRKETQISMVYIPRTQKFQCIFINKAFELFNKLDTKFRNLSVKNFKILIAKHTINFDPG